MPAKKVKKKPKKTKKTVETPKGPPAKFPEDPLFTSLLHQVAGEHGAVVAKAIFSKELTDEEVTKRTGISINLVRRILYDMYDNRVVAYRRVRDESSGWYVYYWHLEPTRAMDYLATNKRLLLQKLEEKLEMERSTTFFGHNGGCPKVPLDVAVENDFKCPRCGEKLAQYDNSSTITTLEQRVNALRQQLMES
ncbi:MAG: transcription factor [Candidatus Hadarchaeota archaeon]